MKHESPITLWSKYHNMNASSTSFLSKLRNLYKQTNCNTYFCVKNAKRRTDNTILRFSIIYYCYVLVEHTVLQNLHNLVY